MSKPHSFILVRSTRLVLLDLVDRAVEHQVDRRTFLRSIARTSASTLAAAYGASLMAACGGHGPDAAQGLLRSAQRRNELVERWLFRHTEMDHARGSAVAAGGSFPAYHVAPAVPVWDAALLGPWTLSIAGRVSRPQRLTLAQLIALPHVTQRVDHFCVEGWNAVATWTGVRVSDLAALAGADPLAGYVDFRSFDVDNPSAPTDDAKRDPAVAPGAHTAGEAPVGDAQRGVPSLADVRAGKGYHESWDVASAMHPQTLVAYGLDGHYLGPAHGAPARLHSPVKLGYKSTKYLTEIVFRDEPNGGYWSDEGYEWYAGM